MLICSNLTYSRVFKGVKKLRHGQSILKKLASFFKFVVRNPS